MDFMGSGGNPGYFNRYAYTFNDPNNTDPDGMQVRVELMGEDIGSVPVVGNIGHLSVVATDTQTGEAVTAEGGPVDGGSTNASDPINNAINEYGGVQDQLLEGKVYEGNTVEGRSGLETLDSEIVDESFSDVRDSLQNYTNESNDLRIDYNAAGPNSNTFGTGGFKAATGRSPKTSSGSRSYPGARSFNRVNGELPQCASCP